jgi:hypothetical protein
VKVTVLTPKVADRMLFYMLYLALAAFILWAGFRIGDHSLAIRFAKDYLGPWEIAITAFGAKSGHWPVFEGGNHVEYMEQLILRMRRAGVQPPQSNTSVAYRYSIDRFTGGKEKIFMLCLSNRIVLYGISKTTLDYLDKAVDGTPGLTTGRLTGRPGKNPNTYIGQWWL